MPRKKPEPQSALAGAGYGKRRLDFEWIDLSRDWEEKGGCRDQGRRDKNKPSIVLNRNSLEEKCKTNSVYYQVYLILHKGETEESPRKRIYPLSTVICYNKDQNCGGAVRSNASGVRFFRHLSLPGVERNSLTNGVIGTDANFSYRE